MSFCRGILFVGGFWRSRALLAVVLWLGGLFYGGMSLLCRCLRALCVVLLVSFAVCHFIVVWRLPALRLLCAAVSALCPVFDGGLFVQHFCVNWCFLSLVCFFCANFSSLLMSVFIFFSVVECCLLRFVLFNISAL